MALSSKSLQNELISGIGIPPWVVTPLLGRRQILPVPQLPMMFGVHSTLAL